jgi:site-specific DNA-methyltransferase (adenine-specific)/adenine-specific DNA-methyltransferase
VELLQGGHDLDPEWARVLFPPERRESELIYHGKERGEDVIADTMSVPLQPMRVFGKNGHSWSNMLIFGDNLQVMKTLLEMKRKGQLTSADGTPGIRLAYIDPPFATKRDFKGNQEQKAYQDKLAGADFLEFMRKRLILLRELLSDDGSLFVHLDYRKGHYVKILLDEVFGEHNFRNELIVKRRITKNLQQQFEKIQSLTAAHDSIFWYSKQAGTRFRSISVPTEGKEEGYWHHFWSGADRPTMRYELLGVTPKTGQWKWQRKKAEDAVRNYRRFLREAKSRSLAQYWADTGKELKFIRLSKVGKVENWYPPSNERIADTIWIDVHAYPNAKVYPTEKDEQLLERVLQLGSENEGDLVLDCFAGSGTTCAVAEKAGRRWIGIDCGKLAVYTMQKRLLNLHKRDTDGNRRVTPKPFTFYNAGLYDFSRLRELPWDDWRFFALRLFQCKEGPHRIGGIALDGFLKGSDVLVFNHTQSPGARVTYDTINDIHAAIGKKVGRRFFIIAPALSFAFQEDYVDRNGTRYYALRIPYSIINELHRRDFTAIRQPADESEVNDTVESVGFDFIRTPEATIGYRVRNPRHDTDGVLTISVTTFRSEVVARATIVKGNLESLSMLLVDVDYDGEVFDLDHSYFREPLRARNYSVEVPVSSIGERVMIVLVDIYGNEFREVKTAKELGLNAKPKTASAARRKATPKRIAKTLNQKKSHVTTPNR